MLNDPRGARLRGFRELPLIEDNFSSVIGSITFRYVDIWLGS